ncbi:MAG: antitoxin [Candidatus Hydrogenedentes bacterium]|nr:antitoxin [Candidatus Hydrogenedentota bacterium]
MKTAKIIPNGGSQAVRLPKEFQFEGKEVYVNKVNGIVMLIPLDGGWESLAKSLDMFSEDFMADRDAPCTQQARESL